jgi:hypothetical protein
MEKPLFESIKPSQLEPPPWVWDRIQLSLSAKPKEARWLHRLIPAAVVASLFLSMASFEANQQIKRDAAQQSIIKVFATNSSDLLVNWDI